MALRATKGHENRRERHQYSARRRVAEVVSRSG
jgi:hypothetical protein